MRITSVQAFLLSYPMPERVGLDYFGGHRVIVKRDSMLIRVETDNGLTGWAPGQASEAARDRIQQTVAPFLTGRTLADPDALRVQFATGPGRDLAAMKVYCAVEVALYDALGKALGAPVSELIGGRVRDRIRLYGSAGMYQAPEVYASEAAAIAELGFRGYKMRPGLGPDEDLRAVRLMREAVGHSVDLMVDAHSWWRMGDRNYSPETVASLAEALAEYEIAWLEEPLPPADHAAYRALRETGHVPIASGEHEPDDAGFADLIASGCVDYAQTDIVCQGGYASCRRVLNDASREGIRFAFHSWGTDLEVLAAAHLGICWPENVAEWLEYPVYTSPRIKSMYPWPLAQDILKEPLDIQNGDLIVPARPGLGIDVDPTVIDRYPWIPGPWSFFTLFSPRQTFAVVADHSVPFVDADQA